MLMIFTPTWVDAETGQEALLSAVRFAIEAQIIQCPWTFVIGRDNPYSIGDHANVLHQYQRARQMALDGGYKALLTVEHDNLLPDTDAVQRLLDTPGDVVYAPYLLRHGTPTLSTWQWINQRNLGESLSHFPAELARARAAGLWKISGAGMGCTLFRRQALEMIPFEASGERNPCPDLGFAEKALRAGLVSMGRFDVPVAHYHAGRWLHPFREEPKMQYIARQSGRVSVDGRFIRLTEGGVVDVTEHEAHELSRLGMLGAPVTEVQAADAEQPIEPVDPIEPKGEPKPAAVEPVEVAAAPLPKRRTKKA